ncbi:hypothetical protein LSAT2_026992 [Lamellibrachia satsuma]|nr:hypothetical protein LSAT2_026992 [Lamellibrachia satsuma]
MTHAFILVQTQENTDYLRQQATVLSAHEQQLQEVRAAQENMTVQTQENTDHLRQQATVLSAHDQQLQEVRAAQENMTGNLQTVEQKVEDVEGKLASFPEDLSLGNNTLHALLSCKIKTDDPRYSFVPEKDLLKSAKVVTWDYVKDHQ